MDDRALPVDDPDGWDVLHRPGSSDAHWSTDNVGEAAPGVHTPLSWSMWGPTGDGMPRAIAHAMGAFSDEDRRTCPPGVQPLLIELTKLVEAGGVEDGGVLSGSGGAEMAIIGDIWKASRDELTIDDVLANHGFHGPFEGEVMSRVWREEPAPLARMIDE